MDHQPSIQYLPAGPSTPQGKPSHSSSESPSSSKQNKRFSFGIPPFRRRPESPPSPSPGASETRPPARGTSGKGWSFPLRLKSRKAREQEQERESSREVVGGGRRESEEERRGITSAAAGDISFVRGQGYPSPSRHHHQGEVIGTRRNEPLLTSLHTPIMHPPIAEPQHFGRAPPSPRDEFPFPIVPPTTHSPPQLARFSPTSSTATTPRLVPRTRPTPLQAIPSSLSPVAPPRSSPPIPNPARHHFPVDSNPSAPHQALTLHPQHLLQSRFTETLPRHSPFSLPSPRPPSPLQLERTPSTDSSISPSIQLPAYEFPRRHPHRPLRMPYEQPVSRFSDWTSTNDSGSIDSPWDEPFPRADDSGGGGGLSRRGSMATGGSGARGWWRDAAPEGVGESDGDADGEENGEETDEMENRELRGRMRQRKAHSHDGSSRAPSRHRLPPPPTPNVDSKPRMISASTQTTEDLLLFYNSHSMPPPPSESALSTSSSHQALRRAPPPPPSPASQLLHHPTSSSSNLRRPPAHSESSSSGATFCTSTADTSVQGLDAFPTTTAAPSSTFIEGLKPPPLSPVEDSRSRSGSSAGLETGDRFRKRMSALAGWMGATKAQKEARRRTA